VVDSAATPNIAHEDVDDFIAHFGKKGMKWGVYHQRMLELHSK